MTPLVDEPVLRTYTIYLNPADLPGVRYAVREFLLTRANEPQPGRLLGSAISLALARLLVPRDADVCLARSPEDDPAIVETWI